MTPCSAKLRAAAMLHEPATAAIVSMLRSLKMCGMAQAVEVLIVLGSPALKAAILILSQLRKSELAEPEVWSIAYHMKSARLPAYMDISGCDFATSEINEATVRTLHPRGIIKIGNHSFRYKASSTPATRKEKEVARSLTQA